MDTLERDIKIARLGQQIDDVLPVELPAPEECRRLRIGSGLSEETMGALVGVTATAISRYETSRRSPRGEIRARYSDVLGLLRARLEAR